VAVVLLLSIQDGSHPHASLCVGTCPGALTLLARSGLGNIEVIMFFCWGA
jgi:hypothetical protein